VPLATARFDYDLPPQLIAQTPVPRRDHSRLLVVDRTKRRLSHHVFTDLPRFLGAGDTLVRNNAAVLPARLHAVRPTGGRVECLLLHPIEGDHTWRCLLKPGRRLATGAEFGAPDGSFSGRVVARGEEGAATVRFFTATDEPITEVANRIGDVPLPPYIERNRADQGDAYRNLDRERYQTVYAERNRQVAVAAPTAGLHFTPELLSGLTGRGIGIVDVTLHVGLGTFRPIATETVEAHVIHREIAEMPAVAQRALFFPRKGRRIAVGTTAVRTVEAFLQHHDEPMANDQPWREEVGLFIRPPFPFRGTDAMITNFHQPRSTLLCLVAAFLSPGTDGGISWIQEIYAEAIAHEYRFFSYGDAMLIL
jgi:S-adenosylmethionine:tRNA ribosyltransferase-isomerase